MSQNNRQLSEHAIAEDDAALIAAGHSKDANGWWPLAAIDSLPESVERRRYSITYAADRDSFRLEAIDWWDDWSFHRHVSGVDVAEEDWE